MTHPWPHMLGCLPPYSRRSSTVARTCWKACGANSTRSPTSFRGNPTHRSHTVRSTDALRMTLSAVGAIGERVSQARDVLLGVGRIASFAGDIGEEWITPSSGCGSGPC